MCTRICEPRCVPLYDIMLLFCHLLPCPPAAVIVHTAGWEVSPGPCTCCAWSSGASLREPNHRWGLERRTAACESVGVIRSDNVLFCLMQSFQGLIGFSL